MTSLRRAPADVLLIFLTFRYPSKTSAYRGVLEFSLYRRLFEDSRWPPSNFILLIIVLSKCLPTNVFPPTSSKEQLDIFNNFCWRLSEISAHRRASADVLLIFFLPAGTLRRIPPTEQFQNFPPTDVLPRTSYRPYFHLFISEKYFETFRLTTSFWYSHQPTTFREHANLFQKKVLKNNYPFLQFVQLWVSLRIFFLDYCLLTCLRDFRLPTSFKKSYDHFEKKSKKISTLV